MQWKTALSYNHVRFVSLVLFSVFILVVAFSYSGLYQLDTPSRLSAKALSSLSSGNTTTNLGSFTLSHRGDASYDISITGFSFTSPSDIGDVVLAVGGQVTNRNQSDSGRFDLPEPVILRLGQVPVVLGGRYYRSNFF